MELWNVYTELFLERMLSLGNNYGVNPWIFGGIYLGAIPLFSLSIAWIIRNYRRGRSILFPSFLASCFFISAYVYLIIAGENVPVWVYIFIVGLLVFGARSTWKKIQAGIHNKTTGR